MIKAILFDIDGVIIRHASYFADSLPNDQYKDPGKVLNRLYKTNDNTKCDKGELSIIEYIKPYLDEMKWDKTATDYLNQQYEFESQFIDFDLLKKIKTLKKLGVITVIASNQNQYRKTFLLNSLDASNTFTDYYFSSDLGYVKSENGYWENVISSLKTKYFDLTNDEIVFMDDLDRNTIKANEFGIKSFLVNSREEIDRVLENIKERVV